MQSLDLDSMLTDGTDVAARSRAAFCMCHLGNCCWWQCLSLSDGNPQMMTFAQVSDAGPQAQQVILEAR